MLYFDYAWDLEHNRILLDEELDIDKLGWQGGDYCQVCCIGISSRCHRGHGGLAWTL